MIDERGNPLITEKVTLDLDLGSLNYLDSIHSNVPQAIRELVLFARSHGKELKAWRQKQASKDQMPLF